MKNKSLIISIAVFLIAFALIRYIQQRPHGQSIPIGQPLTASQAVQSAAWRVYFSPEGGCTEAVVEALSHARVSVLVQAYSFTSRPIAEALVDAYKRGAKVDVIVDKSELHGKGALASLLAESGISVSVDAVHVIAHNKVMVIDGQTVVTGSFNFTFAAEKHNAENLLIIQDRALAERYTDNWHKHREHSEEYQASSPLKMAA